MKLSEVKALLLKELEPFAVNNGFKVVKKDFALRKVYDNHIVTIDFSYNYWQDEIHLFPYVKIRFYDIHRICEDNGFDLNYTAFLNLFILQEIVNGSWTEDTGWQMQYKCEDRFVLYSVEDVLSLMPKLNKLLSLALDYIEENATLKAIDMLFNREPTFKYNPHCSGRNTHCLIGLIVAKLVNNPLYDKLEMTYSNIVKEEDFLQETKNAFERIKLFLSSRNSFLP